MKPTHWRFVETTHISWVCQIKIEDPSSLRRGLSHACSQAARTARAKRKDIRRGKVQLRNLYGKPWLHHSPRQSHLLVKNPPPLKKKHIYIYMSMCYCVFVSASDSDSDHFNGSVYIIDRTAHLQPCPCHSQVSSPFVNAHANIKS